MDGRPVTREDRDAASHNLSEGAKRGQWNDSAVALLRNSVTGDATIKEARAEYRKYWTGTGPSELLQTAKYGSWNQHAYDTFREVSKEVGKNPEPFVAAARKAYLTYWTGGIGLENLEQASRNQTLRRMHVDEYRAACKEAGVRPDEARLRPLEFQ